MTILKYLWLTFSMFLTGSFIAFMAYWFFIKEPGLGVFFVAIPIAMLIISCALFTVGEWLDDKFL